MGGPYSGSTYGLASMGSPGDAEASVHAGVGILLHHDPESRSAERPLPGRVAGVAPACCFCAQYMLTCAHAHARAALPRFSAPGLFMSRHASRGALRNAMDAYCQAT